METKTRTSITDINANGTLSVLIQVYVEYNMQKTILENHREALTPGQFDRAKEILLDNQYAAIEALWTNEIVEAYRASVTENI